MAWEWSHTHEAYIDAERNTYGLSRKILAEIYGEWRVYNYLRDLGDEGGGGWDDPTYNLALAQAKSMSVGELVEFVWARAEEQRTCTNGGHEAWLCPYGCGSHMVPFSPDRNLLRTARKRMLVD